MLVAMQLNIYVPKDKEKLVEEVARIARRERRSKNKIILQAVGEYVREHAAGKAAFGVYSLGAKAGALDRRQLYEEYLDEKSGGSR